MKKHKEHLINLHFYVLAVILISLFECGFECSLYAYLNRKGTNSPVLIITEFFFEILRNIFSRVATLLIGLGYGILIKAIDKYKAKIMLLSFLYSFALIAYNGIKMINQN